MGKKVNDFRSRLTKVEKAREQAAAERIKAEDALAVVEDREARRATRRGAVPVAGQMRSER